MFLAFQNKILDKQEWLFTWYKIQVFIFWEKLRQIMSKKHLQLNNNKVT